MKIELKEKRYEITPGSIIITDRKDFFLIVNNYLDAPCACSKSMTEGFVAIKIKPKPVAAWTVFNKIEDIYECFNVVRVIQPENILLKEI